MNHSSAIVDICDEILNENLAYELCREHKFIQRSTSKLRGHEFIKIMVLPSEGVSEDSLSGLCKRIKEFNPQADLSPQALAERINSDGAATLIKNVFFRILFHARKKVSTQSPALLKALGKFTSVKIQDSTVIQLNEMVTKYEGNNRTNNGKKTSELKIDLIHELLSNRIIDIQIVSRKIPDQELGKRILKFIDVGDLVIRDLGYFALPILKAILKAGAFFLSRLLPNVKVYLNQDSVKPQNLEKYVAKYCRKANCMELQVFLGDLKVPARLVLFKAPKEVVRVRLSHAKKRIKDTGRVMSKGKAFTMKYSAFVTNVPAEMLSAEMVGTVYQLRWEIELIFKQWKSLLKIDVLEGIHHNRIMCLLWGRLCMVLLLALIGQEFGQKASQLNRELSQVKIIKYVLRESGFCQALKRNKVEIYMAEMEKDAPRMLFKDSRSRKTMRGRVVCQEGFYGMQAIDFQHVA